MGVAAGSTVGVVVVHTITTEPIPLLELLCEWSPCVTSTDCAHHLAAQIQTCTRRALPCAVVRQSAATCLHCLAEQDAPRQHDLKPHRSST